MTESLKHTLIAARKLALESGYSGDLPAMLNQFERIRQSGIRLARKAHFARKARVDRFASEPTLYFATISPALSTDEVIEDAKLYLIRYSNMPSWMKQNRAAEVRRVKEARVIARFFRRYGKRVWMKEAA
jgi:hypothetical protein